MAWLLKSIAFAALAGASIYASNMTDTDRWLVPRMMQAAEPGQGSSQPLVMRSGTGADVWGRPVGVSPDDRPPARSPASKASSAPPTGDRLAHFSDGHARLAQVAPGGLTDAPLLPAAGETNRPSGMVGRSERKPASDDASRRLAASIQTELKRVGCYRGDVDGTWGTASQRAMKDFNQRIKATLPTEQPDYILLTLLQGHSTLACGAHCPQGEVEAADGRCKSRALVAEDRLRSAPSEPAAWARSLSQIAAANVTATTPDRQNTAGDGNSLRAEPENLTRRNTATDRARAASEMASAEAAALALQKADADRALADAERSRIAAAEERKRVRVAEDMAKTEAERLARVADAERARAAAEVRRKQELDALAARAKLEPRRALSATPPTAERPVADIGSGTPAKSAPADVTAIPDVARPVVSGDVIAPLAPSSPRAASRAIAKPAASTPRFVARFVPPPTYRIGRLPPPPLAKLPYLPPRTFVAAPRRYNPQAVFGHVTRHSP